MYFIFIITVSYTILDIYIRFCFFQIQADWIRLKIRFQDLQYKNKKTKINEPKSKMCKIVFQIAKVLARHRSSDVS